MKVWKVSYDGKKAFQRFMDTLKGVEEFRLIVR